MEGFGWLVALKRAFGGLEPLISQTSGSWTVKLEEGSNYRC